MSQPRLVRMVRLDDPKCPSIRAIPGTSALSGSIKFVPSRLVGLTRRFDMLSDGELSPGRRLRQAVLAPRA